MNNGNVAIMPNQNAPSAIGYVDPAAVAAAETVKARIQSAYIMAVQRPRSYDQSRLKILEACKRPSFAEKVQYSKPVGGSRVVGPSIRFAELALREWGNILYENQVVYDDEMTRRIQVTIIDLETNATFGASVQISKTVERKSDKDREVISERTNSRGEKVYIVKATDDEIINKQSAMISKTLRNEGLRLIPQEIIEEAIEASRETMQSHDAQDPDAARKKLVGAFNTLGVQPKDLEQYLRHPLGQCSPAEIQDLRSIYSSIRDGEAKWIDYVKPKDDGENGNSEAARKAKERLDALKKDMGAPSGKGAEFAPIEPETEPAPPAPQEPKPAHPTAARLVYNKYLEFFGGDTKNARAAIDKVTGGIPSSNWSKLDIEALEARLAQLEADIPGAPSTKGAEFDEAQSRLLDILGSGGLDLTAAEQADYVKKRAGKKIGELSAEESGKLIAAIDAEIKARYAD
jgi:hypothetical protein